MWGFKLKREKKNPPPDRVLQCEECNGINIHVAVWVDANTNERFDDAALDPWCEDCEEHVALVHDLGPNSTENEGGE